MCVYAVLLRLKDMDMKISEICKSNNPSLAFQKAMFYKVTSFVFNIFAIPNDTDNHNHTERFTKF